MRHINGLLEEKFAQPRFKEALLFGAFKKEAESFFREKRLEASVVEFDAKTSALIVKTRHPSISRELLGHQEELKNALTDRGFPLFKQLRVITTTSR